MYIKYLFLYTRTHTPTHTHLFTHTHVHTHTPTYYSNHFAETVRELKRSSARSGKKEELLVECLSPDFQGDMECVERVATSGLDVFAHNIETVEALQVS